MIIKLKFNSIHSFPYPYYPCSKHGFNCKTCCRIMAWPDDAIQITKQNLNRYSTIFDITTMCINQKKEYCVAINKDDIILKLKEEVLIIENKETKIYKCLLQGNIFWSISDYFLEL